MSDIAIRAENLSKSYQIARSTGRSSYRTLQEELVSLVKRPFNRNVAENRRETFWALKDISFEVKHGEVLGIIGRNGAGKSTLLKILSRITKPTSGRADIYGRVGSLLEVGTGFHPELTGRENVYLNGAVLGMTRRDIQKHFDEIVAFAEVEQFLDTPVKRYSSGMYMRLAFAVAAHLEPEVLVVDEVLAVGDAEFQKKCLGKMGDVAKSGRTVLFVSHNMGAMQQLCNRGIVLEHGKIAFEGEADRAIQHYTKANSDHYNKTELSDRLDRRGDGNLRFTSVEICDSKGNSIQSILSGDDIRIRVHYRCNQPSLKANVNLAFNVYNAFGVLLTNLNTRDVDKMELPIDTEGYFECSWPHFNLRTGIYNCALFCEVNGHIEDWLQSAFQLQVEDGNFHGTGLLTNREQGDVLVNYDWNAYPAVILESSR